MANPTYHATRVTYDENTGKRRLAEPFDHRFGLTLAEVAALVQADPDEITWALQEYGEFAILVAEDTNDDWVVAEDE